jgi:hypothetical protein
MRGNNNTTGVAGWMIALAVLAGALLLATFGMAVYATYKVNTQKCGNWCDSAGSDSDCCRERAQAIRIFTGFNNGINLLTANPTLSTEIIASYFSPFGEWALPFPPTPIVGPTDIYDFFIGYALNPGETNQTVVDRQINWDCLTRTLAVQRTWSAVLSVPRAFTPGSTATLAAGTAYQQDDFIAMRFNCNFTQGDGFYSIVYYREYYDNTQYVSTYSDLLSPVCPSRHTCPAAAMTTASVNRWQSSQQQQQQQQQQKPRQMNVQNARDDTLKAASVGQCWWRHSRYTPLLPCAA